MKGKYEKKTSWLRKVWDFILDIFGEALLVFLALAIGYGIFCLVGQGDILERIGPEWVALLGLAAILLIVGVVKVITDRIRKKQEGDRSGEGDSES